MSDSTEGRADRKLGNEFWKFWFGRAVASLGGSFTAFALPLLIFEISASAFFLGLATALNFLPYLFLGLVIGAWMDRIDRKQFMILADILRAIIISSIPLLALLDSLSLWWIFAVGFINSTIKVGFDTGQFAALPNLVSRENLTKANSALQAATSTTAIAGLILAGLLVALIPTHALLTFDAISFLISAATLFFVSTNFDSSEKKENTTIRADFIEGLKYALSHPVLRSVFAMVCLTNILAATVVAQFVFYAKEHLGATDSEVGFMYAAGGAGILAASFLVEPLRRRFSFGKVAIGETILYGAVVLCMAFTETFWIGAVLTGIFFGLAIIFNVSLDTLQQTIVPNHMLGRVRSIKSTIAWSAIPLGALIGGIAIESTGNLPLIYAVIGVSISAIGITFTFSPLANSEKHTPPDEN